MSVVKYHGTPYHVWNQATNMDEFLTFLGAGPLVITRGEGAYVYNQHGTRYINGISSLWNVAAGLSQEKLIEAAAGQMRTLAFNGCWSLVHPPAIELCARLVQITGGHYQHVMLGSNGSDAIEAAIKIARQFHKQSSVLGDRSRNKIISLRGSYHGWTLGCLSTSGLPEDEAKFGPLVPGFVQIDPPYCYRCPYGKSDYPECGLACAQALEDCILAEGKETVSAFILEPVMGDFGKVAGPDEYYVRIGEICRKYGLLLIADEVTTGFGRTGKLFATQDWQVKPDILCLGKAITNGYFPLSATLTTEEIFACFHGEDRYFNHGVTHGGHPVGCAVALAAIDIILEQKLWENAARMGAYLKAGFEEMQTRRPLIGDIRVYGLMVALELVKDRRTRAPYSEKATHNLMNEMAFMGLILSARKNQLRLMPPLVIDQKIADEILQIIDRALDSSPAVKLAIQSRMAKEIAISKIQR